MIGNKNEFEDTILKLGDDNKQTKKYLMSSYRQGNSTSIKFNEFIIIHSRDSNNKKIMIIIRYTLGTKQTKNDFYKYIFKVVNDFSNFATSS